MVQKQKASVPIKEILFQDFTYSEDVAIFFDWKPVAKRTDWNYQIRIAKSFRKTKNGSRWKFEYFTLDYTGLIIGAPKRLARKIVNKIRIIDIDEIANFFHQAFKIYSSNKYIARLFA